MKKTKIEWCDSTWNPVTGCLHGCEYCYARRIVNRFGGWFYTPGMAAMNIAEDKTYIAPVKKYYGEAKETEYGKIADITAVSQFLKRNGSKAPYPFGFVPTFRRYKLREPQKWTKPRTIFVCSMADLFGEWVPDEWIEEVFAACEKAPQHRYLFLTKNPKRYYDLVEQDKAIDVGKLPAAHNMWFGTTVTSVTDKVFWGDAWNTFLSIEPLLTDFKELETFFEKTSIKWVIIGAETGNRKDKVVPKKEWVDNIVRAADMAGLPVFMKDSLIPIVGEENMRREFPWEKNYDV